MASRGKKEEDILKYRLSTRLEEGQTLTIASDAPFPFSEKKIDQWNTATLEQYFDQKLDLPQYIDQVHALSLSGQVFVSISDKFPIEGWEYKHPLHKVKILSHIDRLRNLVLERAAKKRSVDPELWNASDVASWFHYNEVRRDITILRNHFLHD